MVWLCLAEHAGKAADNRSECIHLSARYIRLVHKSTSRFDGCSETGLLQTGFELGCKRGPYSLMFSSNFHSSCKSRISDAHLDQQEIMDYVFSPSDNKSKAEEVLKVSWASDCSQQPTDPRHPPGS